MGGQLCHGEPLKEKMAQIEGQGNVIPATRGKRLLRENAPLDGGNVGDTEYSEIETRRDHGKKDRLGMTEGYMTSMVEGCSIW